MEPKKKQEALDLAHKALQEVPNEVIRGASEMFQQIFFNVLVRVEELKMEIADLKASNQRRRELTNYVELLSSIPHTNGTFHYEMTCAVTELHELMGFKKHNKG